MSAPRDETSPAPSRPARGRLGRAATAQPEPPSLEASEVLQGQAAAVLAALARMQLRLDVLAREQSELFAKVLARLDQLEQGQATAVVDEPPVTWPLSRPADPPAPAPQQAVQEPRGWEPAVSQPPAGELPRSWS